MDAGTAHDMIEDLMVQLAIVRSELFLMTEKRNRIQLFARALYEETKRCGSKHDAPATMDWEEYEQDLDDE